MLHRFRNSNIVLTFPAIISVFVIVACSKSTTVRDNLPPLTVVADVDIPKYMGTWYEIAHYPQRFQEGCTGTTANYSLQKDSTVRVTNKCFLDTLDGEEKVANGYARIPDPNTPAKLEVSFFRPFWGKYWVIDLAEDYSYAVVGHPGRDYLWILSRKPTLDDVTYNGIIERLGKKHYSLERLQRTVQKK